MSAVIAPVRTHDQRMAALAQANKIRFARARMKKLMRAGMVDVAVILDNPPEHVASMKVFDFLVAMHKVGAVKAQKWMRALGISPAKTVGGLSERQRQALIQELSA